MAADGNAPAFDVPTEALTRRVGQRRSITLNAGRASKREIHALQAQGYAEEIATYDRPQTRGDCLPGGCNGARPCPWVSCKAHLAIDVDDHTGSLKLNFPSVEVWEMAATCAYDIADEGGRTLEDVGAALSITRERTRQLEVRGLAKTAQSETLIEYLDAPPTIRRPAPPEPKRPVGRRARMAAGLPVTPEHKPRLRNTPGHMIARLALARGATIDEAMRLSGLTHASVQQLVWRVARAARRGAL
jgi:hypothetical protein